MALSRFYARRIAERLTEKVCSGEYVDAKQAASEFLAGCTVEEETAMVMQLGSREVRKRGMPIMGDALALALLTQKIDEHLEFEDYIVQAGDGA